MANLNPDIPRGFSPVETLSGAPVSGKIRVFQKAVGYATAIGVGDAVLLHTDGKVQLAVAGQPVLGVVTGFGGSTNQIFGDADGFDPDNLDTPYVSPASTGNSVLVCLADDVVFSCQSNGIPDQVVGSFGVLIPTAIGSARQSQMEVDITGTSATDDVQILEFPYFNSAGTAGGDNGNVNDPTIANAEVNVVFVDTTFAQV